MGQISPWCFFSSSVAAEEAVDLRGRCISWFMTLYKLRSAAGLTELETEVHSGLGMDLLVVPVPWGHLWSEWGSLCLPNPCSPAWSAPGQDGGLVPGEAGSISAESCVEHSGAFHVIGICPEATGGLTHVTRLCYPAVDLKPGLFWQPHLLFHGLPPDGRGVSSFPMWRSWVLFRIPLALACSVRYFKQGSFPRFCCAHPCLCPFLACSLRAAALQPSIYMALICLSLFGTYMTPIGPGPECPPIFNIFIFTRADAHAYLWGQEVPLLLLYRWRTLNGNWLNWEQVVVQEGNVHCSTENDITRDGLSATVQCWKCRSHHSGMSVATNGLQGPARSTPVLAFSVLNLVLKSKLSFWYNFR